MSGPDYSTYRASSSQSRCLLTWLRIKIITLSQGQKHKAGRMNNMFDFFTICKRAQEQNHFLTTLYSYSVYALSLSKL